MTPMVNSGMRFWKEIFTVSPASQKMPVRHNLMPAISVSKKNGLKRVKPVCCETR